MGLAAVLGVMLAVAGFLLIHVGLFLYLPWSVPTKALILVVLGLIYLVVPLIFILRICSRRTWLKLSRADELTASLTGQKKG